MYFSKEKEKVKKQKSTEKQCDKYLKNNQPSKKLNRCDFEITGFEKPVRSDVISPLLAKCITTK